MVYLTRPTPNGINGTKVEFHLTMPEYPATDPLGTVHIVSTKDMKWDEVVTMHMDVS